MGTLIFAPPTDKALHLNGSSQYAYRANPAYQNESAGGVSVWMRINTLLTANGAYGIVVLADSGPIVGMYGRSFVFCVRRNSATGTGNYLDITAIFDGSTIQSKSGTTALSAGSWMPVQYGSDAKIYLNGTEEAYQYRNPNHLSSGWYGDVGGTNKDLAFGALRGAGVASAYSPVDLNNILHLPGRPFTSTEAAEIAAGGMDKDPATYSFSAELDHRYDFDGDATDSKGSEDLTEVNTPTYIVP